MSYLPRGIAASLLTGLLAAGTLCAQEAGGGGGGNTGAGGGGGTSTGGGTTGGGTTNPGGGTGNVGRPPGQQFPGQQNPNQQQMPFPEMQRPIFISGKVMLSSGEPLTESVAIERVCNGQVQIEGYTSGKGKFSFQLGQNNRMFADASTSSFDMNSMGGRNARDPMNPNGNVITERELMNCEIRASLPGHRSQNVSLAGRRMMDNPDIGTIILHRLGKVEGRTLSITSETAPKDAKKALKKGTELASKGKLDEAVKELQKATELHPQYAMAWLTLGQVHAAKQDFVQAKQFYNKALEADNKLIQPYIELASLAMKDNDLQGTAEFSAQALKLDPFSYPKAYMLNAVANYQLEKFDEAEKAASSGIQQDIDKRFPQLEHILGVVMAQKQNYTGAVEHMKAYLTKAPKASNAELVRKQLAEVERLAGANGNAQAKPENQ